MANNAMHFDKDRFIRKSRRLDQEKAGINLCLNFFKPHFEELLRREIRRWREKGKSLNHPLAFQVTDAAKNILKFQVIFLGDNRIGVNNSIYYVVDFTSGENIGFAVRLLTHTGHPEAERLSAEFVEACAGLIEPLGNKLFELIPEELSTALRPFYANAKDATSDTPESILRLLAGHLMIDADKNGTKRTGKPRGALSLSMERGDLWSRVVAVLGGEARIIADLTGR